MRAAQHGHSIEAERLSNGILVVTSEKLSSADNPQHVAQATRLRDILQKPSV
ncbi:MAG: hypothetical protein LBB76_03580 [Azoarcus sp.]|nr:hypothetical protein [Azoarcus sp.]